MPSLKNLLHFFLVQYFFARCRKQRINNFLYDENYTRTNQRASNQLYIHINFIYAQRILQIYISILCTLAAERINISKIFHAENKQCEH